MRQKWFTYLIVTISLIAAVGIFPSSIHASGGVIKPTSSLYFLQTWFENIQISLRFTREQKLEYLFTLTEKRVEEMKDTTNPAVTRLYEKHYQYLDRLASLVENKEAAAARIEANNLRQQAVLAEVYIKVPEEAKDGILSAQENSSKQVARTIERVSGPQEAQEYIDKIETIQQLEKIGQVERVEQLPMEGSPNADPSQATPKEIKGVNPLLPGQDLNQINQGQDGGQGMEPAGQVEMNAPAGQN